MTLNINPSHNEGDLPLYLKRVYCHLVFNAGISHTDFRMQNNATEYYPIILFRKNMVYHFYLHLLPKKANNRASKDFRKCFKGK